MAPVINTLSPAQGPAAGGNTVAVTGTGFIGITSVRFGTVTANHVVVNSGLIRATPPPGSGTVTVTVRTPGSTSNGLAYTYVAAPLVVGLSPAQGPLGGGNTVTVTGSGLTNASAVRFGAVNAAFTLVDDGQITATAPAGSGVAAVTVTTPGGTSNGVTYTYVAAPVIGALSPAQGPAAGGNVVTITGTGFTGASAVRFGAASVPFTVVADGQITATAPPGSGSVAVTVTGPGGTSDGAMYAYLVAPAITGLNPGQGPAGGGNSVTITGTGLTGASVVRFGAASAVFTVVDDGHIDATAPAGAGSVPVSVTGPGGTSNGVTYTYAAAAVPVVSELVPGMGPLSGGNTVTVNGTGLSSATAVHFGATPATNIQVLSDTQLTVDAPAGSGTVVVTVTTPGGTSQPDVGNPFYTYLAVPVIDSLVPDTGPEFGGTNVTVEGTGLTYTDQVLFGAALANFAALSDTSVIATAPAGTGVVTVTVHTPAGTSNGLSYTYQP